MDSTVSNLMSDENSIRMCLGRCIGAKHKLETDGFAGRPGDEGATPFCTDARLAARTSQLDVTWTVPGRELVMSSGTEEWAGMKTFRGTRRGRGTSSSFAGDTVERQRTCG